VGALAGGLVLLCALVALALPGTGSALLYRDGGPSSLSGAGISLDQRPANAIVLQTPAYKLVLSKKNGGFVQLADRVTGAVLVDGTNGCEWGTSSADDPTYVGGCAFAPTGPSRFSYAWDNGTKTLTLSYTTSTGSERHVDAVVTLRATADYFDLRLALTNRGQRVIQSANFPVDLFGRTDTVQAGYAPNFLPGVKFGPAFFSHVGNSVLTYPGRWSFADFLAIDVADGHLALSTVNPPPGAIAPVDVGFVHEGGNLPCAGTRFCLRHLFHTWIAPAATWSSPIVRLRVGEPVEQSIVDYRVDNGIDAYPSVQAKLGSRLDALSRAPLIKADLTKGVPPFRDWTSALGGLPSPALVHPVAFGPGGFDATDPDVLPPDPSVGTVEELRGAVMAAHARGDLVMPYLNVSWWNPQSPTIHELPQPLTGPSISVLDSGGKAATEQFSGFDGFIVSPSVKYVRDRVAAEIDSWRTDVPADCLFFDQIGARPWRYDFNPAASSPLAYYDGWLSLFAPFADRCLMVEDGWDRLAASFSGFDSSLMLMEREFTWLTGRFGPDWTTYPLALWLLHDKVLLYQHDLFEKTFTADPEILTWNLAYGYMLSYDWATGLGGPWLGIATAFQRALGPHFAGAPLTSYKALADGVTETRFGTYSVVANWTPSPYEVSGFRIAPRGFLARTDDGSLVVGELADASGPVYRIVQGGQVTFSAAVPASG
jgi:hypothetical protein